jgi:serpin B
MDLILPRNAIDLEKWIKNAKSDRFAAGTSRLKPELLDLKLPKFEFSRENQLLDDLQEMGAKHLVEPGALPGIAAQTYLSYLAQKTYIRVDEEGTEAAAITEAVAMTLGIHEPPKTKLVVFDRPFFFAIRHRQSGARLFLGTIWNLPNSPAAKQNAPS